MNYQKAFNRAYTGLRTQGQLAYDGAGCFFYSSNTPNVTCAVGQLVNPELREKLEWSGIGGVGGMAPGSNRWETLTDIMEASGFPIVHTNEDIDFLAQLQDAHDSSAVDSGGIDMALERLRVVASNYNLEVPA